MIPTVYALLACKSTNDYTKLAVSSFLQNTVLNKDDKFIVVDNDGIDLDIPNISIIHNAVPQSFAKNSNDIINQANGRDVVILSNDVVFTPKWNQYLGHYRNLLIIPSCNQTHLYSTSTLNLTHIMDISDFKCDYKSLESISQYHTNLKQQSFFESLLMSFYVFRLTEDIYTRVGLLDERFGIAGGEDVDYRIRSVLAGIPVKFFNHSYLLHFGGKSTWNGSETELEIHRRNQEYKNKFFQKWGSDLTELLLSGGNFQSIIEKFDLFDDFNNNNFSKIIKEVYKQSHN